MDGVWDENVRKLLGSSALRSDVNGNRCGYADLMTSFPYGDRLKLHRRYVHSQMGTKQLVGNWDNLVDVESSQFLLRTLRNPEDLTHHLQAYVFLLLQKNLKNLLKQ
jgi:hypothetical protein